MMIDCGEGAQQQMRRQGLKFSRLTHIFISHLHGDHCFGLPGLLSTLALHEIGGTVNIVMPAHGMDLFKRFINFFCKETSFSINFIAVDSPGGIVYEDSALTVTAFPLNHRIPCFGYIFQEKPKARHLKKDMLDFYNVPIAMRKDIKEGADFITPDGATIPNCRLTSPAEPAMSYAYCSDTLFDTDVAKAVKGVHTIYHEATYADDNELKAAQRGHSTARQAAKIAQLAGAQQLIIGHYSKRYTDVSTLLEQASQEFNPVIAADEGLKIDLI